MLTKADWKVIQFKMYYIEYSSRRGITTIVKDVSGHGIARWKTQRREKYFDKLKKLP